MIVNGLFYKMVQFSGLHGVCSNCESVLHLAADHPQQGLHLRAAEGAHRPQGRVCARVALRPLHRLGLGPAGDLEFWFPFRCYCYCLKKS